MGGDWGVPREGFGTPILPNVVLVEQRFPCSHLLLAEVLPTCEGGGRERMEIKMGRGNPETPREMGDPTKDKGEMGDHTHTQRRMAPKGNRGQPRNARQNGRGPQT